MSSFELNRYLDYCSEMLSLSAKLAALYAQNFSDSVVLSAVGEVENLSIGLSNNIWQKIAILQNLPDSPKALYSTLSKAQNVRITLPFLLTLLLLGPALSQPATGPQTDYFYAQVDEANYAEHLEGLAESLLSERNLSEAQKVSLEILRVKPSSQVAKVILAKIAIASGQLERAQQIVSQLLEADAKDPDCYVLQGMIYMLGDTSERSITFLEKGLELGQTTRSPGQLASYSNTLVLALHQQGQAEKSLEVCLESLRKYPQEPDLYLTCSRLYRERKDYQAALDIARRGLAVDPEFPGLFASVALAEAGLGHQDLSEKAYQELLSRDPELAEALRETLDGVRQDSAEMRVRID